MVRFNYHKFMTMLKNMDQGRFSGMCVGQKNWPTFGLEIKK